MMTLLLLILRLPHQGRLAARGRARCLPHAHALANLYRQTHSTLRWLMLPYAFHLALFLRLVGPARLVLLHRGGERYLSVYARKLTIALKGLLQGVDHTNHFDRIHAPCPVLRHTILHPLFRVLPLLPLRLLDLPSELRRRIDLPSELRRRIYNHRRRHGRCGAAARPASAGGARRGRDVLFLIQAARRNPVSGCARRASTNTTT